MSLASLESTVNAAFDARDGISTATKGEVREAVDQALELLDNGQARVAERPASGWKVHQWLKKAVLLSFRRNDMRGMAGGPGGLVVGQGAVAIRGLRREPLSRGRFRAVPGAIVRRRPLSAKTSC